MKRRRFLSVLLALLLALSMTAPALAAEGEDNLTRGEFLAALYAMSGAGDPESAQADFDDVSPDSDLAPAIRWAVDSGIVNGYGVNGWGGPVPKLIEHYDTETEMNVEIRMLDDHVDKSFEIFAVGVSD